MNVNRANQQVKRNTALLEDILKTSHYTEVFIWAGKTYLDAISPIETWKPENTTILIAEGGSGMKNKRLKEWLLDS